MMRAWVMIRGLFVIRASGAFSVAGLLGERWSVAAASPRSALRVAEDGVNCHTFQGPDEHQTGLVSKSAITLSFNMKVEYRVVIRVYFRLRLARMQEQILCRRPKR